MGPESVIGDLDAFVADHPHREAAWGRLMTSLYQVGRQAEALRTYQRATKMLSEELGIDPSPALQRLEEQILLQDPALSRRRSAETQHNIPAPAGQLIGRGTELTNVKAALVEHRLVTLLGPGGSGKTRLALEAAWQLTAESHGYDDGIWLVRLDDLADPTLIESAIGASIGMPESVESTVRDTLIAYLRNQRALPGPRQL